MRVIRLPVVPAPMAEVRPIPETLPGSGFAGDCFGIVLFNEARDDLVVALVGVVSFSAALIFSYSATLLVSSTASLRISSPVGPFLTSVYATYKVPSVVL